MKFNYQARTKAGILQSGTVDASSREAALDLLEKYGLYVTSLEKTSAVPIFFRKIKLFERISTGEIVSFSRQLAIMFKSMIPIVEIFYTLGKQTKNPILKDKIIEIAEDVEGGASLSKALARHPKVFNEFFISMVKSGEVSGELSEVLDYLANHLEREQDFHSKIVGAMIYPVIVLLVVLGVIIVMVLFVIPQLGDIIEELGADPPFVTKLILDFSDLMREWGILFLAAFALLVFFLFRFFRSERGKRLIDKFALKVPILGRFLQKVYLSRFAENLSTLIAGGLPIAKALEITGDIVGNETYKGVILKTRDGVMRGETISSILESFPANFPPLFVQMTLVGEKAGQVSPALMNIVNFYRKDIDRTLDNFVSFIEPLLIIFLGLMTAGLMASVLMPIYQITMTGF